MFARLNLRHNLRHTKTFFKKILSRGKLSKYYTSRMLYIPLYPTNLQIFGTKSFPRRRFLQHYYRDTFIESHRKPKDVPEISYGGREIGRASNKRCTLPFCVVSRCHYFDILQKNTYKTSINSTSATKIVKNLHICNFCSTFAAQRSRLNDHGISRLFEANKPK